MDKVFAAAEKGDNVLKALLQNGADVNAVFAVNELKLTALDCASAKGHTKVVSLLIQNVKSAVTKKSGKKSRRRRRRKK